MKKVISLILTAAFLVTAPAGCNDKTAPGPAGTRDGSVSNSEQTAQSGVPATQAQPGDVWQVLFTYDEANAVQFNVKAAIPGEEEAWEYPWGGYDDPLDEPKENKALPKTGSGGKPDAGEINERLQEALKALPPEQRKAAEEAMRKAQKQAQNATVSQEEQAQGEMAPPEARELPPDWNDGSNMPELGGRLELVNGDTTIILEMSEYCVDADTTFTVTPIKDNKLPEEFLKSGFSLNGSDGEKHVTLKDYAVVTFLTGEDPGENVVIKSLSEDGDLEYTYAAVTKLGDTYRITGAVEHFSTVGYGSPALSPEAEATLTEYGKAVDQRLRGMLEKLKEKAKQESLKKFEKEAKEEYDSREHHQTVEFDEILFTSSATGNPLQLHLRAKLVDQPFEINPKTGKPESYYKGKVWIKFYTWMPEGHGVIYMVCNNAKVPDFYGHAMTTPYAPPVVQATLNMTSFGGSTSVAYGVGSYDISGKTYSNVDTVWRLNPKTGGVQVTFTNMKGAAEKTFITGKYSEKTKKQANKKLKWFLD